MRPITREITNPITYEITGADGISTNGPSLDLNFVSMDEQYKNLQTLDLNFTDQTYQRWENPSEPQGAYKVWIGPASW